MQKWTDEEIQLVKQYYGKEPYQDTFKRFDRTKNSVIRKAAYLGVSNTRSDKNKIQGTKHLSEYWKNSCPVNHNFFGSINNISSYCAGLLAADGCVDDKNNRVVFGLHRKDIGHVQRFNEIVGFTGKIYN